MRKLFIFNILLFAMIACTAPDQEKNADDLSPRDPRIPGGTIGTSPAVDSVSDLTSDSSVANQVKLTWNNPIKYESLDFTVRIFRRACDLAQSSCTAPPPGSLASQALYQVFEGKASEYLDTNVTPNTTYSYFLYVNFVGSFSNPRSVSATPSQTPSSLSTITALNFWPSMSWKIGADRSPNQAPALNQTLFGASITAEGELKGKLAYGKNGAVAYLADTDNNRVVIMIKQNALACINDSQDPLLEQLCLSMSQSEPFVPFNVLGQPDRFTNKTCKEHNDSCQVLSTQSTCEEQAFCAWEGPSQSSGVCGVRKNECMSKPTHLLMDNDHLIVSDSGNDRVLVYEQAPIKDGCDINMGSDIFVNRNCTASSVIGKKNIFDLTLIGSPTYTLLNDGRRILSNPGALAVKDGSLYIADRGFNRVVKIKNYLDSGLFSCNSDLNKTAQGYTFGEWDSLCSFEMVLGQRTFFENKTFKGIVLSEAKNNVDVISSEGTENFLTAPYDRLLRRYFTNPSAIQFSSEGHVLISANENFSLTTAELGDLAQSDPSYFPIYLRRIDASPLALKGRILVFDESALTSDPAICNQDTFGSGNCDAIGVLGQLDFTTLPVFTSTSSTQDYRNSLSYGLTSVSDFEVFEKGLLAVDNVTNDIYFWRDYTSYEPFNVRIVNPLGAQMPSDPNRAQPNLKSIASILYDTFTNSFLISDPGAGYVYQVRKP